MKWTFLILSLSLLACKKSKNENCVRYQKGFVAQVSGPDSGKVNQDIVLNVTFFVIDGCGRFEKFEESTSGKEKTISVLAKHTGCICTDNLPRFDSEYHFRREAAGTYYFRFESAGSQFITDTLVLVE